MCTNEGRDFLVPSLHVAHSLNLEVALKRISSSPFSPSPKAPLSSPRDQQSHLAATAESARVFHTLSPLMEIHTAFRYIRKSSKLHVSGSPLGSGGSCCGNMSPPQIDQAATAVTMPAKPRKRFCHARQWIYGFVWMKVRRTRDCIARSMGVGMVGCERRSRGVDINGRDSLSSSRLGSALGSILDIGARSVVTACLLMLISLPHDRTPPDRIAHGPITSRRHFDPLSSPPTTGTRSSMQHPAAGLAGSSLFRRSARHGSLSKQADTNVSRDIR